MFSKSTGRNIYPPESKGSTEVSARLQDDSGHETQDSLQRRLSDIPKGTENSFFPTSDEATTEHLKFSDPRVLLW